MFILNALLSPFYRVLAVAGAVLVAIGAIYAKGRSDASTRASLKTYKDTQDAIERSTNARRASERHSASGGLLDDDGYRRD